MSFTGPDTVIGGHYPLASVTFLQVSQGQNILWNLKIFQKYIFEKYKNISEFQQNYLKIYLEASSFAHVSSLKELKNIKDYKEHWSEKSSHYQRTIRNKKRDI